MTGMMDKRNADIGRCVSIKQSSRLFLSVCAVIILITSLASLNLMSTTTTSFYQRIFTGTANNNSSSQASRGIELAPLQPRQHVYFLKTHKTAGSTVYNILAEYCRTNDLLPLLPTKYFFNQGPPLKKSQLLLIKNITKYDMVFHHHIFTRDIFEFLHRDTFTVTTLREPYRNFISAFQYYRNKWKTPYLMKIRGPDPLMEFFLHHEKYEAAGYTSFTNNRQSMDLGYDIRSYRFDNIDYINRFIEQVDNNFDLVIIAEYFDESLILLKRALRWNTQDIIYFSKNKAPSSSKTTYNATTERLQRKHHAKFSKADNMLYAYFVKRLKKKIEREQGFSEEVEEFKNVLPKIREYCERVWVTSEPLVIPAGKWNGRLEISPYKCKWLGLDHGIMLTKRLQDRQRQAFPVMTQSKPGGSVVKRL